MKKLLRKKWFRRLCQAALVLVSVIALSFAVINWRGARLKRDAIARMEARGWPSDLSDVLGGMPPDSSNYAMIPVLRETREEMEKASLSRQWAPPEPGSPRARMAALFEDDFSKTKRRGVDPKTGEPDFSKLPADGPFGTTAESFLKEYDRRNGETIRELVVGLSLPETRQPVGAEKGANWFSLTEAFGLSMRRVSDGLLMRAYAAMVTGDSAKAAESIIVILRLSEVVGSRNFAVSHAIQRVLVVAAAQRVKQGMEMHVWTEADVRRIRGGFEGIRIRQRMESCVAFTGRVWVETWSRWETDRSDLDGISGLFGIDGKPDWPAAFAWCVPAGYFAMNAAAAADHSLEFDSNIGSTHALAPLLRQAGEMRGRNERRGKIASLLSPRLEAAEFAMIVVWTANTEVIRRQTMLACDLESYRLKEGTYPAVQADVMGVLLDPLHESPFVYRKDGDFFVLYSTGPDGKDDGGVKVKGKGGLDQADWVW